MAYSRQLDEYDAKDDLYDDAYDDAYDNGYNDAYDDSKDDVSYHEMLMLMLDSRIRERRFYHHLQTAAISDGSDFKKTSNKVFN